MRAATVVQQLCKSCRTCFMFYCMFYFTCDRSCRFWRRKTGRKCYITGCRWHRSGRRCTSSPWWHSATTSFSTCSSPSWSKVSQSTAIWLWVRIALTTYLHSGTLSELWHLNEWYLREYNEFGTKIYTKDKSTANQKSKPWIFVMISSNIDRSS